MMLYLPAEGGEVQRRNRRNALKNAKVEIDFKITDLHKTAPRQRWGAVLCCAEKEKSGKQNKDPGCKRNKHTAALEGGQIQKHMGQERKRHGPSLPYDSTRPYREAKGTERLDQYGEEIRSGAQVKKVHHGKEKRDEENCIRALHP